MTTAWLSDATKHDLHPGIGNGPFGTFLGVILHVNVDENGTPASFWGDGNSGQVCPNFQVFKDGSVDQMLPFDWQPWCQIDGNFNYAAIETAGLPSEPLTAAQMASIARILRVYHDEHGMPLQVANSPGQHGLGTHEMGGPSWGGHACPGTIRANQRTQILALAAGSAPTPEGNPLMADKLSAEVLAQIAGQMREELNIFTRRDSDDPNKPAPGHEIRTVVSDEIKQQLAPALAAIEKLVDSQTGKLAHSPQFGGDAVVAKLDALAAKVDALTATEAKK